MDADGLSAKESLRDGGVRPPAGPALNRLRISTMSAGVRGDAHGGRLPPQSCIAPLPSLPLLRLGPRATRRQTRSSAPESPPDHPREPVDEHGGEPNGHHRQPRQRPHKRLCTAQVPSRGTRAPSCAHDDMTDVSPNDSPLFFIFPMALQIKSINSPPGFVQFLNLHENP